MNDELTPRHPATNGRVGDNEFITMTQAEVDRAQAACNGTDCFFFPGCRPGECPKDGR
jgi:hypothetical protein